MSDCNHKWVYQGLVYWHGDALPGSSARRRFYTDKYFCEKCLEVAFHSDREHGNSYQEVIGGAVPR